MHTDILNTNMIILVINEKKYKRKTVIMPRTENVLLKTKNILEYMFKH
jgi:hypothetical protein